MKRRRTDSEVDEKEIPFTSSPPFATSTTTTSSSNAGAGADVGVDVGGAGVGAGVGAGTGAGLGDIDGNVGFDVDGDGGGDGDDGDNGDDGDDGDDDDDGSVAAPVAAPLLPYPCLPPHECQLSQFPNSVPVWPDNKRIIGVFNHKGGVGKSTSTVALGWKLASLGHRVLLVDADPQCNLTGFLVDPGYDVISEGRGDKQYITKKGPRVNLQDDALDIFYRERPHCNIRAALAPLLGSQEFKKELQIEHGNFDLLTEVFQVKDRNYMLPFMPDSNRRYGPFGKIPNNLYLLAGHMKLHKYEDAIHAATTNAASSPNAANIPGMFYHLFQSLIARHGFDYVLVDMSPSAGVMNKLIVNSVHYLIVPCSCDYFSNMAVRSLGDLLLQWDSWKEQLRVQYANHIYTYKLPKHKPIFLGHMFQLFTMKNNGPAHAFQRWIDKINTEVRNRLIPTLERRGMTLPANIVATPLALIRNTQSAGAAASKVHRPVWAMNTELFQRGDTTSLLTSEKIRKDLKKKFNAIAEQVIGRWNTVDQGTRDYIQLTQRACQFWQELNRLHIETSVPPATIESVVQRARDLHFQLNGRQL